MAIRNIPDIPAYSAPTLGSTSVASGATVSTVEGLGLYNVNLGKGFPSPSYLAFYQQSYSPNLPGGCLVSSDGITWTQGAALNDSYNPIAAYGNNVFVAIDSDYLGLSKAYSSTSGTSWTQRTMPANKYWKSIAYGSGVFVAVGSAGYYEFSSGTNVAATTTDGITWTQRTMPSSQQWSAVAFGNGKFVAVSTTDAAAYSSDGINWTQSTLPSSENWNKIAFGNSVFVALPSYGQYVARSTDGITWTQGTLTGQASWHSIAYGNGTFIANGSNSGMYGAYAYKAKSTDGTTWENTNLPIIAKEIIYANGAFAAVSGLTTARSTDGTTWTYTNLPQYYEFTSIAHGEVEVMQSGTLSVSENPGTVGQVLRSTGTGVEWTTVSYTDLKNTPKSENFIIGTEHVGAMINVTNAPNYISIQNSTNFKPGQSVVIYNNSSSDIQISNLNATLRLAGSVYSGSRNLVQRAYATITCVGTNEYVCFGPGVS